jgi:hypothetical protein
MLGRAMRPTIRKAMQALLLLLALAVGVAAAALAWVKLAPRHAPAGQSALATLDPALSGFREAFNAAQSQTRLLVLLSPT